MHKKNIKNKKKHVNTKKAEERISMLEQSSFLAELAAKEEHEDLADFFESDDSQ